MNKRLLAAILCFATMLSLFTGTALAADSIDGALGAVNIFNGDYEMNYFAMNGSPKAQKYTYFNLRSGDGSIKEIPAYCINPDTKGVPQTVAPGQSIEYLAEEASNDPKIVGIIANGYPHRGLSELKLENKHQAFYATKMALWCYLIDGWDISRLTVNPSLSGVEKERGEKILAAAKDIYQRGISWNVVPQPNITVTADKDAAYPVTIDGGEYKQQIFTVNSETWVCDYDISVFFTQADEVPQGTRIVNMNNEDITKIRTSATGTGFAGQFKVLYPAASVEGDSGAVQLSFQAKVYKYAIFYALCAETDKYGNLQRYMCDTDPQREMRQSTFSRYSADTTPPPDEPGETPPTETTLIIQKVETGTNTPLSGALFEVKAPDGTVLGSFASDATGKVVLPLTLSGQYVITEKSAPKWHLLGTETTKTVSVTYGNTATVTFENAPYGSLRVEKIDADSGDHLAGAKVDIKHIESGATYTATTDLAGSAYFDRLRPGAYQVREVAAPSGWVLDSKTYTVNVVSAQEVGIALENKAKPGLTIIKYDEATKTPLPDVSFSVYCDTVLIGTFATNELGEINLVNLQPGTYLVREVATDSGHVLNSTPQQIELTAGEDGIRRLTFFNALKPGMHILKVDSATMQPLANARFHISKVGGSFSKEYTTDRNGEIDLSALEPGAYTVTELTAPDGYLMDEASRVIQLNPDENARFVFANTRKPSLLLVKYCYDGEDYPEPEAYSAGGRNVYPLAGATFKIGRIGNDGTAYSTYTTDRWGEIYLEDMEPGTYSVIEVAAPIGYVLDPTERHVELFPGRQSELNIENLSKPNLQIIKTDAITGEPLPGVTFTVRKADSSTLSTITTDEDGIAVLEKLDPGVYEVTEQSVPSSYLLDTTPQLVTLVPNKTATVQFQNYPRPSLEIVKTDTAEHPIPDAVFTVTKKDGTLVGDFSTGQDGKIHVYDLDAGYYIITEKSVPAPYILDATPHEVLMVEGKTTSITLENKRLPDLTVSKVDSITKDPVQGAKFTVWYAVNGSLSGDLREVGKYATSEDGTFALKAVEPGWYRITETEPAPGYTMKEPTTLDIFMEADHDKTITFENQPLNSLIIKKVDAADGHVLQGAKFRVRYFEGVTGTGGTTIGEYETSAQGTIVITGLKAGTYVIEETHAPEGYVIDDAPKTVYMSGKETAAVTVEFANQPDSGLTITKLDSVTREPLAGATFEVRDSAGGVVGNSNGIYTTDESGTIHLPGLATGTYTVKETKAPDGYVLSGDPQTVKLVHGETHSLTFYNTPEPEGGGLLVKKLDADTSAPISGVTFEVTNSAGAVAGNNNGLYTTDKSGIIHITGLPADTYVVRETKAAPGYLLDENAQTVKVADGETHTLTFYNQRVPVGDLTITKLDSVTKEPLAGAVFEVRNSAGGVVGNSNGIYTTAESGTIHLPGLATDTYTVKETKAPEGYVLDGTPQTVKLLHGETHSLTFYNAPKGALVIVKQDGDTKKPLAGATFKITTSSGEFVAAQGGAVSSNGLYTTDKTGQIVLTGLEPDTYVISEYKAPSGYELDATPQTVAVNAHDTQTLYFYNDQTPEGGLRIIKLDEETRQPIKGVEFSVTHIDGRRVGTYRTDSKGIISLPGLTPGWYTVTERRAADGYELDAEPRDIEVRNGRTVTLEVTNRQTGSALIRKIDSATGEGIYGVTFLVSDAKGNPIGQYTSDQQGYVYIDHELADGKYTVREIQAADGYIPDTTVKTFYVEYGGCSTIIWKNTAVRGQIQIVKKSADYNSINGLPAGTLLAGATFEIYNERTGNKVDTIVSGSNGLAVSKQLPLGRYTVREVKAPANYAVNGADITAVLEYSGQIIRFEVLNKSVSTGVSITKTGPKEAVSGQPVRYVFSGIANTGTVALDSFYWRDTLPTAVTLNKVVTGSYNRPGSYKIVYRVNGGDYRTLVDNLSTAQVYTIDATPAALGLAANERVTEIMFTFGQVPGGFAQVETPMLYTTAAPGLTGDSAFTNVAEAGGVYNGQWIQAVSRWVTTVYGKPVPLPRTGY